MNNRNRKRTVLLTGASSGIGLAICDCLLQRQHKVVAAGRSKPFKEHDLLDYIPLDLSEPDAIPDQLNDLVAQCEQQSTTIDSYIGCGGYGQFGALEQFSYAQMRETMDVNFLSHANIVRTLVPVMKRQGAGDIILMGSEAALSGARNGVMYCASKFALRGFAQALRDECGKSGIRVGIVNPGMVETSFFDKLKFGPGKEGTQHIRAEDVAEAVMLMLDQPRGTVIDEINMSPLKKVILPKSEKH